MARSYNRLWHKLIDMNLSKGEMRRAAGITTNALAKLGKNESVPLETLEKICAFLKCGLNDIVEITTDDELPAGDSKRGGMINDGRVYEKTSQ